MVSAITTHSLVGSTEPTSIPGRGKSLSRRPTLVRKRSEAGLDLSRHDPPSSPSKRVKVAFNEDVEVKLVDEWDRAPEIVREEVNRALRRYTHGDFEGYQRLVNIYSVNEGQAEIPSNSDLEHHTAALLSNVALLNRSCSSLVRAVLHSDWVRRDEHYVSLFTKFLGNLVSAQGAWLAETLESLVASFVRVPKASTDISILTSVSPLEIRRRIHTALRSILKLVPTGSHVLAGVLSNLYPSFSDSKKSHLRYVHNVLTIVEYAPELRAEALALITDRVVKLDVEVQVDIADLEDDIGEDIVRALARSREELMDESDDEEESEDDSDLEDEDPDFENQQSKTIAKKIEKLDLILDNLFENYDTLFSDPAQSVTALDILLSHFKNIILPTYRSRHTQFLLFHFAQSSPELVDIFIGVLLRTAFDNTRPVIVRQASASYLASFVARGLNVSAPIARDVFDYISTQLTILRSQYLPQCRGPDPRRYSLYYALAQALFYIFCFRWRDLTASSSSSSDHLTPSPPSTLFSTDNTANNDEDSGRHPAFLPGIRDALTQNVFCSLNPLRVCAPVITQEFARLGYELGVIYVYHLLETNKRVRLTSGVVQDQRQTALTSQKGEEWQRLDGYFPFDPYRLPRSKRWVEAEYREWSRLGSEEENEGGSSSDSDDEEGIEDDAEEEATGTEGSDEN